jgi:hypothetical protein
MDTGDFLPQGRAAEVRVSQPSPPSPNLHLLQRLIMSGTILPFCLPAFMECTGTTLKVMIIKQSKFIKCRPRLMLWNYTENLYNQEVLKIFLLSYFF